MTSSPPYRLGFAVLAHDAPEACAQLIERLLDRGDAVALHLDKKADRSRFETSLRQRLGKRWREVLWAERVDVRWAEWSMVEATLNALHCFTVLEAAPQHVLLLSGSDYPIRPLEQLRHFLQRHANTDFIDHHDAERTHWVTKGAQQERYRLYHWLNWRRHPRLFDLSMKLQNLLRVRRKMPAGLRPYLGSQWWALRWESCQRCMSLASQKEVRRFFKKTWVPDELFFQSVCASQVPSRNQLDRRMLTHVRFGRGGAPIEFFDEHLAYLKQQPFFFARKLAPGFNKLRDTLDRYAESSPAPPPDRLVGQATAALDDFFAQQRQASQRHFLWGRPGKPPLGELGQLQNRYAVVVAEDRKTLNQAQNVLRKQGKVCWHGELFAADRIEYAPGAELAEYPAHNVALRDQDSLGFLASLLRNSSASLTGFCWQVGCRPEAGPAPERESGKTRDLLAAIARDLNCHLIYVGSEPGFKKLQTQLKDWDRHRAPELFAQFHHLPMASSDTKDPPSWQEGLSTTVAAMAEKPRLLMHIGMQRTGSTALQRWLRTNSDALAEQGVGQILSRDVQPTLSADLNASPEQARRAVKAIIDAALKSRQSLIVLSDEDLVRIRDVERLKPLKAHFDVRVLCYLRQQDQWLESWYNQILKWPWSDTQQALSLDTFLAQSKTYDWLDYQALLKRWKLSFGREALHVVLYEASEDQTNLFTRFFDLVGTSGLHLQTSLQRHNQSLRPDALMLLRNLPQYQWPQASRVQLINALSAVYEGAELKRESQLIPGSVRQDIRRCFEGTNAAVARDYFDRPDGILFTQQDSKKTTPEAGAELPSAAVLANKTAPLLIEWFLRQLEPMHVRTEWSDALGPRLGDQAGIKTLLNTDALNTRERAVWHEVQQTRHQGFEAQLKKESMSEAQRFLLRDLGPVLEVLCAALVRRHRNGTKAGVTPD